MEEELWKELSELSCFIPSPLAFSTPHTPSHKDYDITEKVEKKLWQHLYEFCNGTMMMIFHYYVFDN